LESSGLDSKSYFAGANYLGSFTNIFYADLGVNYGVKFNDNIGLDSILGLKYALNNPQGKVEILNTIQSYDIGADRFIAYFGLGVNYAVTSNIELGLNYLGNFGDESIQNSGFFNVKVGW
ncbi:hypothetical protein CCY99_04660, partial [Helicobacter sp. 16-1353]|uniref:autotransporter outer membrane beta-barrel domain-containing protein n=1 Tax=Helicobacter sp. 16-1353 TaxID=2004996 RepID=UPI000DCC6138